VLGGRGGVGGWVGGGTRLLYVCVCMCLLLYTRMFTSTYISFSLFTYVYIYREREIIQYTFSQGIFSSCTSTDLTPLHLNDDDICPKFA